MIQQGYVLLFRYRNTLMKTVKTYIVGRIQERHKMQLTVKLRLLDNTVVTT